MLTSDLLALFSLLLSDYIIEEKNAVLQKKENEGFGFVLRGAKGKTSGILGMPLFSIDCYLFQ